MAATLHRIAELAINRPLMVTPGKLEVIAAVLGGRIGIDASELAPAAARLGGSRAERETPGAHGDLPYRRTPGGTAIISVIGSLINRGAWIGASSGLVSYEGLKFQLAHAAQDPKTKAVILDFDTPGGEAVGALEAAAAVRGLATIKPVVSVVDGLCCSAGYALASGCTRTFTTSSGISGSIGVVMLHVDISGSLAKAGVKPTLIYSGAHKVDGNAYNPLPDTVAASLKAEISQFYDQFAMAVAAGRQNLTVEAIKATEAKTFVGAAAVAAGLADEVGTLEGALVGLEGGRISLTTPQSSPAGRRAAGSAAASNAGAVAALNATLAGRPGAVVPAASPSSFIDRLNAGLPANAHIPETRR